MVYLIMNIYIQVYRELNIFISHGSTGTVGYLIITSLQIFLGECASETFFLNRSILGENTDKSLVARFFMVRGVNTVHVVSRLSAYDTTSQRST